MRELEEILKNILNAISDDFELETLEAGGQTVLHVKSSEAKLLIGQKGANLRSINHILRKIAQKKGIEEQILVDVNEYQLKKIKEIEEKAKMLAKRAKTFQYDVEMPPMSAYERLIVHATLASDPELKTESHGEGKSRRLVIKYVAN